MYVPNADFFQLGDLDCAEDSARGQGTGGEGFFQQLHRCFGLLSGNRILFRAEVVMAPLQAMLLATART